MPEISTPRYVLCVHGGRAMNKRAAICIESVHAKGMGVKIWALPRFSWILDKSENPTLPTRIGRFSVDIGQVTAAKLAAVMCFHWTVLPLAVGIGMIRRVPVLYYEYDHFEMNALEGSGSRLKRRIFSKLVRFVHRICLPWVSLVACIHMDKQALKRHLERWQPSVLEIHNYPTSVWRESGQTRTPSGKMCFVYIGGVYLEKGVGAAAEAFQLLPYDIRKNSELHIFGRGDADLIQRLGAMPGTTVHNAVTPAEFRKFTATHRCCGLALLAGTPRYKLCGTNFTKLFEYLALGIPVIGTRVGEIPQWIDGRQVGLLIDADLNPKQLAVQMQKLADDDGLFDKFSRNAYELMSRDEMTWEHEWNRIDKTGLIDHGRKAA